MGDGPVTGSNIYNYICNFIANFSATMVTSLRKLRLSLSLSLSVSLSLSLKVPHAQYRKRFRASYNTEREREIDGSDVTLVALKLGKKFALFLAKTLILAKSFAVFLAKSLHLSLHLSFSPLIWREFTHSVAKILAHFETVCILRKMRTLRDCFTSVKRRERGSKHRNKRSNFLLHRPSSHRKNESNQGRSFKTCLR